MGRNQLTLYIGLAIIALLVLLGLTWDRWQPVKVVSVEITVQPDPEPAPSPEAAPAPVPAPVPAPAETAQADVRPSFDIIRVEPDGTSVVAGRAAPGAEVTVLIDGAAVGRAKADEKGEWVLVTTAPLPTGAHDMTATAVLPGQVAVTSEQAVALAIPERGAGQPLVVLNSPNAASRVLTLPEAQPAHVTAEVPAQAPAEVTLGTVDYNEAGDIIFSGTAAPGTTVRIYVDNAPMGAATAGADGKWTFTGTTEIAAGTHTLRADALKADGSVASRVELPFLREAAEVAGAAESQPAAAPSTSAAADASAGAAATTGDAEIVKEAKTGRIVIQPGNNLWRISRVLYGKGMQFTVIYEANKDQIRDPSRIYPGQILTTPGVVPPEKIDPKQRRPLAATP